MAKAIDIKEAVAKRPRRKFRRPARPMPTRENERKYRAVVMRNVKVARQLFDKILFPALPKIDPNPETVNDSYRADAPRWQSRIKAMFKDIRKRWESATRIPFELAARREAGTLTKRQLKSFQRQMRSVLEVDVFTAEPNIEKMIDGWVRENRDLVRNGADDLFREAEDIVLEGFREGRRAESMVPEIEKRLGVAESRATLIAVDQINKLNGALNRQRQTKLGFERFKWRTSKDEAVRPEHQAAEGKTYTWAEGHPTEGFPGQPVRCRCHAEPVFDDLLE